MQLLHDIVHSASQEDWEDTQYVKPVLSHIWGATFQFNYTSFKRIVFHTDRHHIKMAIFLRDSFLSNINTQNILYYDQSNQI